jgi:hypothetical protein
MRIETADPLEPEDALEPLPPLHWQAEETLPMEFGMQVFLKAHTGLLAITRLLA